MECPPSKENGMKWSLHVLCSFFSSICLLLLRNCHNISGKTLDGCRLTHEDVTGYSLEGDIILGGLLAIHLDVEYPKVTFQEQPPSLKCQTFHIRYYRYLLAVVYAIQEINQASDILPNITLGFKLYDSCYHQVRSLMGTTWILSGKKQTVPNFSCYKERMPSAIVGDMPSKASIPMARILGLYRYPQISYASAHPILSDKLQFPSFFRTIPNDDYEVIEMAHLVAYFNWTWVGIITTDNELGRSGSQLLTKKVEESGGCVAFLEILPIHNSIESVLRIIDVIKNSKATVIVVYSTMENLIPLMEEASYNNITSKVWFACSSWSITSDFPRVDILTTLNGSIGIAQPSGEISGFKEFIQSIHPSKFPNDIFIKTFWEKAFGCVWPTGNPSNNYSSTNASHGQSVWCTGEEKLDSIDPNVYDVYNFRYSYKIYNAIYAIAHALHQMHTCIPGQGPFVNGSCADVLQHKPWQLSYYIKRVNFINTAGEQIYFDKNGDIPLSLDILNWQLYPNGSNQYINIGKIDDRAAKGNELQVEEERIVWNGHSHPPVSLCSDPCQKGFRRVTKQGQKICCFDCVPCSEGEILNPDDGTKCLKCPEDQWPNSFKEKCMPKSIEFLAYNEFLGSSLACISIICCALTFSVLCLFIMKHKTPIVKANNRGLSYLLLTSLMFCFLSSLVFIGCPNMITCMLRQVLFGIIFSLCLSAILAKTTTVIMVFSATCPDSRIKRLVGLRIPIYIVPSCTIIQIVLCLVWLCSAAPFEEFNMVAESGVIVLECNEGSKVFFACVLGYMGLLASVSLLVAFLARNLPDTFNEAKFITFSMLVFASVWITFVPAYLSTKGKNMVAVEIFAIISSSAGLLVCIFFPKCYIILLQPERNNKRSITGRKGSSVK
ncbi:extracellular calcium-sensing receptor-like [Hyla sarda]|uniref:extracellular calcium-sensing receptor-like n=1 Tax=Hyla sarda TaxID=327740 RepID=UPI0024C28AD9|nr:extracellular calcium-sensing receptor-like [Hyla sarda]